MIFTTFNSTAIALVPDEFYTGNQSIQASLPAEIDRSLSAKESRRAFASALRYEWSTTLALQGESVRRWRNGLNLLKAQPVFAPIWSDKCYLSVQANAGATLLGLDTTWLPARTSRVWLLINQDSRGNVLSYELVNVTASGSTLTLASGLANTWPAGSVLVPVLVGRFQDKPSIDALGGALANISITVEEHSAYGYRLTPWPGTVDLCGSTVPAFSTVPILKLQPDASAEKQDLDVDVDYEHLGFLREEVTTPYTGAVRRSLSLKFVCRNRDEIAQVERLFIDRLGPVKTFLCPTWLNDVQLTADVTGSSLTVVSASYSDAAYSGHPGQPYLALTRDRSVTPIKATSVSGSTVTLSVAPGGTWPYQETKVSALLLCRFSEEALKWDYSGGNVAVAKVKLVEVTGDYATGTIDLPAPAFLYKFTHNLPSPQIFRYTSYEQDLTVSGDGTYTSAAIEHGDNNSGLKVDTDDIEIRSGRFSGNPLQLFFPFQLEAPLLVQIWEADSSAPATRTLRFTGEVKSVSSQGNKLTASAVAFSLVLDRKIPRFLVQRACNYAVYSTLCGIAASSFGISATATAVATTQVDATVGGDFPSDWFSQGFISFGSGVTQQYRQVLKSTRLSSTSQRFFLSAPFAIALGGSFTAYPGCDRQGATCRNKFNNYQNFGGFEWMPLQNPNITAVPLAEVTGGKK